MLPFSLNKVRLSRCPNYLTGSILPALHLLQVSLEGLFGVFVGEMCGREQRELRWKGLRPGISGWSPRSALSSAGSMGTDDVGVGVTVGHHYGSMGTSADSVTDGVSVGPWGPALTVSLLGSVSVWGSILGTSRCPKPIQPHTHGTAPLLELLWPWRTLLGGV